MNGVKKFALVLFAIGLVVFLIPVGFQVWNQIRINQDMDSFQIKGKDLNELRQAMQNYNVRLYESGQSGMVDQLSYEQPDFLPQKYGVDSDVLAIINIPAINQKLPVYNGASEENMTLGAVYLAHTSLPIGGNNVNTVIAAHTSYRGYDMFRNLPELKIGDEITITNYWETLTYRVCQTKIISPSDYRNVYIQPGRDLITLSTCHPFPENYQRYLVFAERVK